MSLYAALRGPEARLAQHELDKLLEEDERRREEDERRREEDERRRDENRTSLSELREVAREAGEATKNYFALKEKLRVEAEKYQRERRAAVPAASEEPDEGAALPDEIAAQIEAKMKEHLRSVAAQEPLKAPEEGGPGEDS